MENANATYSLDLDQAVNLIDAVGAVRTVIVEGGMGTGKSSGIKAKLKVKRPQNTHIDFDCTNKDIQDLTAPQFKKKLEEHISDYVEFVPNAELGVHLGVPVTINFDEFKKASDPVRKGVRAFMLEREICGVPLPEGSIIYGTSNLSEEGLGDVLLPHQRNAIIVVRLSKSTNIKWIEWGIAQEPPMHSSVLVYAKNNPQLFDCFTQVKNPEDNLEIYHPKDPSRLSFVTQRSLHIASDILHARDKYGLDDHTVTAALIGCVGAYAGPNLMASVKLGDRLPSLDAIKQDPMGAVVPDTAAATCMVVFRALASIEREWINEWMTYLMRLDTEAQGMFVKGVIAKDYPRQWVANNPKFQQWMLDNNYVFSADQA
jgi:hypothetical protein